MGLRCDNLESLHPPIQRHKMYSVSSMTIGYLKRLSSEFGTFPASISLYSKVSSTLSLSEQGFAIQWTRLLVTNWVNHVS